MSDSATIREAKAASAERDILPSCPRSHASRRARSARRAGGKSPTWGPVGCGVVQCRLLEQCHQALENGDRLRAAPIGGQHLGRKARVPERELPPAIDEVQELEEGIRGRWDVPVEATLLVAVLGD